MAKKDDKKTKTKAPDLLADVVQAVTNYDDVRLKRREINGESEATLHKKAVRVISIANSNHGEGFTSIAKARSLINAQWHAEKVKMAEERKGTAAGDAQVKKESLKA